MEIELFVTFNKSFNVLLLLRSVLMNHILQYIWHWRWIWRTQWKGEFCFILFQNLRIITIIFLTIHFECHKPLLASYNFWPLWLCNITNQKKLTHQQKSEVFCSSIFPVWTLLVAIIHLNIVNRIGVTKEVFLITTYY